MLKVAKEIQSAAGGGETGTAKLKPAINRAFWHDHSATETLSCALLDAWLGECQSIDGSNTDAEALAKLLDQEIKKVSVQQGISELAELFHLEDDVGKNAPSRMEAIRYSDPKEEEKGSVFGRHDSEARLPNDAAVYLCWYSQLRDLLDRNPEMAAHIGVCALPGGGVSRSFRKLRHVPLRQAVRRNARRFPDDFMFEMDEAELAEWRSQLVTSKADRMGLRYPPMAFAEQGVAMLSSVLNSQRAIEVNIAIMRALFCSVSSLHPRRNSARSWQKLKGGSGSTTRAFTCSLRRSSN